MQTRRKTWILGGLLALLLILVACSQETDSMDSSDREENAEDVREVTHAMGTTTIEGNPKKLLPSIKEQQIQLYHLGLLQ